MDSYPKNAQKIVEKMAETARAAPDQAMAFQGAPGANSHLAALQFAPDCLPLPCFSFEDALDAVKTGQCASAIIPIENSLHGRVADMHFLLPESGLHIVAEYFMPIHHCLMAQNEDSPIRSAMSHPQALGQCRHYLREHALVPVAYADTAGAAAYVAQQEDESVAAIAPTLAAQLYGLQPIAESIEDKAHNMTRFVVLSKEQAIPPTGGPLMTTFIFEVKNIPASLYKAMGCFATNGVNMTKLESYYREASFAATEFYADIEGAPGDANVDRALEELDFHTKSVKILGSYAQARPRTAAT